MLAYTIQLKFSCDWTSCSERADYEIHSELCQFVGRFCFIHANKKIEELGKIIEGE